MTEYGEAAERLMGKALITGDGQMLKDIKMLMDTRDAAREEGRIEGIGALEDMVWQFAYKNDKGQIHTGGLSVLENAFDVLDWDEPHNAPDSMLCDEPGCKQFISCGFPTESGYRRTCGKHYVVAERLKEKGK